MAKRILLVSATQTEMISAAFDGLEKLITGVGMVATTCALTRKLAETQYDLVVNIGIAGTFTNELEIGQVVWVAIDEFSELGVEDHSRFIAADDLGLMDKSERVFHADEYYRPTLLGVTGITVNRVHGNAATIERDFRQFECNIESMEGAAVAYVCKQFGVPWVGIRGISNMVEPRNREAWNIPLAIQNLHKEVFKYLYKVTDEA
jgi:futalosine hydrolase